MHDVRRGDELGLLDLEKVAGGTLLLPLSSLTPRGGYREDGACFSEVGNDKRQQTQVRFRLHMEGEEKQPQT